MADNVTLNSGSGGDSLAADDISGVKYPRGKIVIGADGTNDGDVSATNPLPVKGTGTAGTANAGVVTVQGIASMTPIQVADNGGTISIDDGSGSITVDGTVAVSGTVAVTDNSGSLTVDDGGGSLTVDGTVAVSGTVAVTDNSGSLTVDDGGSSLTVDGSVTVAGSGTAGTANAGVVTIQGIASMTPVQIADNGTTISVDDGAGSLTVDGTVSITGTVAVTDNSGSLTVDDGGSSLTVDGSVAVTNAGTFAVQVDGSALTALQLLDDVVLAEDAAHASGDKGVMALTVRQNTAAALSGTDSDYQPLITDTNGRLHVIEPSAANSLTSLQLIDDTVYTDDAAFTPGTSKVLAIAGQCDETATDSVDEGDAGALRITADRKLITTEYAHAAGGGTAYAALSTAAVLAASVKASAGKVLSVQAFNNGANEVFCRIYNMATSPGTGDAANIVWRGMIPGNAAGAGFAISFGSVGLACGTGIGIRVSGAVADNDATSLAANEVMFNLQYA